MLHVGFTGTRDGMTIPQRQGLDAYLWGLAHTRVLMHLGDCLGADAEAWRMAKEHGMWTIGHPPSDPKHRAWLTYDETREARPYLDRNHDIVDASELLIATPRGKEVLRSGTWATVRYARKRNVEVVIIDPWGRFEM